MEDEDLELVEKFQRGDVAAFDQLVIKYQDKVYKIAYGYAHNCAEDAYDLSQEIANKKMEAVEDTGADIVVTACPGCRVQLIDNIVRRKMPQKVLHIMELLSI